MSSNYFSVEQMDTLISERLFEAPNIRFLNPGDTSAFQSVTVVNSSITRVGAAIIRESNESILAVCSISCRRHILRLSGQQRDGNAMQVEVYHDEQDEEADIADYRRTFDVSVEEAQALAESEFYLRILRN